MQAGGQRAAFVGEAAKEAVSTHLNQMNGETFSKLARPSNQPDLLEIHSYVRLSTE